MACLKMNVMTIFHIIDNNKCTSFVYMLKSSNVWHDRLGRVDYHTLHRLINLKLLPKLKLILTISVKLVWKIRWPEHLLYQLREELNL